VVLHFVIKVLLIFLSRVRKPIRVHSNPSIPFSKISFSLGSSSDTNASMEQERYFDAIVKLTPTKMPFSVDLGDADEPESIDITPLSVRKTAPTNRLQNLLPTRVLYDRPRTSKFNIFCTEAVRYVSFHQ
jgi:hypothetical protein